MTTKLTKEALAAMLHGGQYGNEITDEQVRAAEAAGLVVVFGYSDDNVELRGAIHDEAGCYEGSEIMVARSGILFVSEEETEVLEKYGVFSAVVSKARKIKAVWCDGGRSRKPDGYCWRYETDIPHATFDILEDGEKFCLGIVFSVGDL